MIGLLACCAASCGNETAMENGREATNEAGSQDVKHAQTIEVAKAAEGAQFQAPDVEIMESFPVQFAVTFTKEVPTPGHKVEVEGISEPDAKNVIVAKLRQISPKAPSLTVMDSKKVRCALGSLKVGEYTLEIRLREDDAKEHALVQTVKITAK